MLFLGSRSSLDVSKKWGMLALVNHLFKIYFKVLFRSQVVCCLQYIIFFGVIWCKLLLAALLKCLDVIK